VGRPSQGSFEPCLSGLSPAWQLQAAHKEQPLYVVPTKPQISFHPEAPTRCQGFVLVSLPLCQKPPEFQQQRWQKGKRNLCAFQPAWVSQAESKMSLGSASCHGRAPATARWGEMSFKGTTNPAPRFSPTPTDQGSSSARLGEVTGPCWRLTTAP